MKKMKTISASAGLCLMVFGLCAQDNLPTEIPNVKSYQMTTKTVSGPLSTLATSDQFGRSVANIGDLDNDGIDDLAIGAPNDAGGGVSRGAVYICFMNADGSVKSSPAASEIQHSVTISLSNYSYFGTSVTGLGDLNGDGIEDIAVGAPGNNSGIGAVWVIFLTTSGTLNGNPVKITNSFGGLGSTTLSASGAFGTSVANVGDVNNDGKTDIAVGAPGYNGNEGQVWILRLRGNGNVKSPRKINEGDNFAGGTTAPSDELGYSVAGTGDLNGDRIEDIVVGMPGCDDGYTDAGGFWILYLDSTSATASKKKISNPFMTNYYYPNGTDVELGRSLGITDVNEDGYPDLMAGIHTFNSSKGGFYFMLMDSVQQVSDIKIISYQYGWNYTGPGTNPQMGVSLCEMDLQTSDGHKRYVTGANFHNPGSNTQLGSFYVLTMDSLANAYAGKIVDYTKISSLSGNFSGSLANSDFFGIDAAPIGDIDGDGYEDIAVGAHGNDDGTSGAGAVWILRLDSVGKVLASNEIRSGSTNFTTLAADHNLGWGMCPAGDFDNDGVNDVFVGAPGDDTGGGDRGCVYLIYLNSNGTVKTFAKIAHTASKLVLKDTDKFGVDIDTIGDIDHNGTVDLVVGAYLNDDAGGTTSINSGAVYIVKLNSNGSVKSSQRISATQGNFGDTLVAGTAFGGAVDGIGDFDGDGIPDIATGGGSINGTGAAYIICLDTAGKVKTYKKINNFAHNFPYNIAAATGFGGGVQMVPDMDGNGVRDLMIGHTGYKTFGIARGGIWIAYLDASAKVIRADIITDSSFSFHTNLNATYSLGQCMRFMGTDSLGFLKILAGGREDELGTDRGSLFIMRMPAFSLASTLYGHVGLHRNLDGAYYNLRNRYLYVKYNEQYFDLDSKLTYDIYDRNRNSLVNNTTQDIAISKGDNKLKFDVNLLAAGKYYVLEVKNQKNEIWKLRFKKNNPPVFTYETIPDFHP